MKVAVGLDDVINKVLVDFVFIFGYSEFLINIFIAAMVICVIKS